MLSTRARARETSLTLAAVVMTLSGVSASVADQVVLAACLPAVDRRRTGVGTPSWADGTAVSGAPPLREEVVRP
jgi:hypothetical protein